MAAFYQSIKDSGLLTPQQYKDVQQEQSKVRGCSFYMALLRTNVLEEEQVVNYACSFFGFERIDDVFKVQVDFQSTEKMLGSIDVAIRSKMFVYMSSKKKLTVIVNDPENETLKAKATSALNESVDFALVTNEEFRVILQYQLMPRAIKEQAENIESGTGLMSGAVVGGTSGERSNTQRLLDMLIQVALERRASDLHLQPLSDSEAQALLRVDGELYPYAKIKADILPNLRNRLKTMASCGGDDRNMPVEGQISTIHHGRKIDTRINILLSSLGYDFNIRFIDSDLRSLEELGLSQENLEHYTRLLHMTKGLVILCGPTGSGKTSLLYAGFKKLLAENKAIFTIEDPVEIVLPGVTQLEVKKEQGLSYAERFPSALRHDPDIIGIGETRTLEVARQTVQAANTGHLVFTTLHTNDAIGAISRLTNLGLEPYTIGDVLAAVVAQRLVRRVCPHCVEEYELSEDSPWREKYSLSDGRIVLKRGKGCEHCAGTGYLGRTAVNEFLLTTPSLRDAIQKNATRTELEAILCKDGFKSYIQDAREKALQGITTFNEVDKLSRDIL